MKENDNIRKLAEQIREQKNKVQATVLWVKAKDVKDTEMSGVGVSDDVEYNNIITSLGDKKIKPKEGALCLIAVINGQDSSAWLLECDKIDTVSIKNDKEDLATLIEELFDAILAMSFTTNYGPTTQLINETTFQDLKLRFKKLIV